MITASVAGFLFGFVGSVPVAGPISVLVFARGVENRFFGGVALAVGGALAEGIYAGLALWGFAELLSHFPVLVQVTRATAAILLAILGVLFLCRRSRLPGGEKAREGWGGGLLLGFTITILNPTLMATWSAAITVLFASGWVPAEGRMALPFGLSAAAGIVSWFAVLLVLVGRLRYRFHPRALDKIVRAMGGLLLVIALWFVVLLASDLLAFA
jgi:threonine/homoserine/homoserine lactone efflux protein